MPKPVKQELNSLTHFMIDSIPEFRSLYDEILDCRRIYNEMLHSDDSSYGKLQMAAYMGKVVDEIEAGVGNTILSGNSQGNQGKSEKSARTKFRPHKPPFRMAEAVHSSADILCRKTARTILRFQPRQTA